MFPSTAKWFDKWFEQVPAYIREIAITWWSLQSVYAVQARAWMATSFPYGEEPVRLNPAGAGYRETTGF
jgi:hypothetical protein